MNAVSHLRNRKASGSECLAILVRDPRVDVASVTAGGDCLGCYYKHDWCGDCGFAADAGSAPTHAALAGYDSDDSLLLKALSGSGDSVGALAGAFDGAAAAAADGI